MTIEEAEARANAGDIEYMLLLGEYYAGQGEKSVPGLAAKWFNKACESMDLSDVSKLSPRVVKALFYLSGFNSILLTLGIEGEGLDKCKENVLDYYKYSYLVDAYLKTHQAIEGIDSRMAYNNFVDASYWYGFYLYLQGAEDDAMRVLNLNDKKSRLLYALCCKVTDSNLDDYCKFISFVEDDVELARTEKNTYQELVYLEIVKKQATIIRMMETQNCIDREYNFLMMVYNEIRNEQLKQGLAEELGHYRKNIFGKMKYVE